MKRTEGTMLSSLSIQAPREQVCIATEPIKSLPSKDKTLKPTTTFAYHIVGLTMLTETRKKYLVKTQVHKIKHTSPENISLRCEEVEK